MACSKKHELVPQNENPTVQTFLDSRTFANHRTFIESVGQIAYSKITEIPIKISDNETARGFVMQIENNGRLVGYVEIADLESTKFLPNEDRYAMNFVDLRNFDITTKSGKAQMVDLNYDNFVHSYMTVSNNRITSWASTGLSHELKLKYKDLRKSREATDESAATRTHGGGTKAARKAIYALCDSNGNNDISFGECYKCAKDAIDSDGFSSFICDFPGIGWFSCWGSTSAACVIISARY